MKIYKRGPTSVARLDYFVIVSSDGTVRWFFSDGGKATSDLDRCDISFWIEENIWSKVDLTTLEDHIHVALRLCPEAAYQILKGSSAYPTAV